MIDMDKLEKIRQEIERRIGMVIEKQNANPDMSKHIWYLYEGKKEAFADIYDFIDSLEQEQPREESEGLEKECKGKDWGILQDMSIGEEED